MRKRSDEVFDNMGRESIIENLQKFSEVKSSGPNLETNYLRNRVSLWRGPGTWCAGMTVPLLVVMAIL